MEEFKSKLDQIAAMNRKGVLAITGALQPAALEYARSQGIGIIRLLPDDQIEHVMYFRAPGSKKLDSGTFQNAVLEPDFIGRNRNFYAESHGVVCDDFRSLLARTLQGDLPSA